MRAFTLLTVCVGVLVGLSAAWAAGPVGHPANQPSAVNPEAAANRQFGEVVGSFTFPDPPIPPTTPYHNIPGLEHDGRGNLYCSDLTVPQFFVVNTHEPTAQLIEGPFGVQAHSVTPKGITADRSHVYIGDVGDADIDVYDLAGGYVRSFSVMPHTGWPLGITFSPITEHLYVVDGWQTNVVFEFAVDGTYVQEFPINGLQQNGLAFDPNRCSYWIYDRGTDTVRHYDLDFVEMESFPGTNTAGFGLGEGVAVIRDRLYVISAPSGWPTVVVFDVSDAMLSPQIALCRIFEDGFESGDFSAWSGVVP